MLAIAWCLGSTVSVRVRIGFIWLVSGYAHVFVLLFVVTVTLPHDTHNF